jgi:hypothetical protein
MAVDNKPRFLRNLLVGYRGFSGFGGFPCRDAACHVSTGKPPMFHQFPLGADIEKNVRIQPTVRKFLDGLIPMVGSCDFHIAFSIHQYRNMEIAGPEW